MSGQSYFMEHPTGGGAGATVDFEDVGASLHSSEGAIFGQAYAQYILSGTQVYLHLQFNINSGGMALGSGHNRVTLVPPIDFITPVLGVSFSGLNVVNLGGVTSTFRLTGDLSSPPFIVWADPGFTPGDAHYGFLDATFSML
jgi:hypothetical protein